jgi:hypothetical protein
MNQVLSEIVNTNIKQIELMIGEKNLIGLAELIPKDEKLEWHHTPLNYFKLDLIGRIQELKNDTLAGLLNDSQIEIESNKILASIQVLFNTNF